MKRIFRIISVCLTVMLMISAVGCSYAQPSVTLPKLETPTVTIDDEGVATWGAVKDA